MKAIKYGGAESICDRRAEYPMLRFVSGKYHQCPECGGCMEKIVVRCSGSPDSRWHTYSWIIVGRKTGRLENATLQEQNINFRSC